MKHKDGHWVDILSRASAIFDENGKAVRIIGTHIDISDRKIAEEALLKSETRLKEAQNVASIGSWEFNVKAEALEWSDELFKIYGLSTDRELRLEDAIDNIHPDDLKMAVETFGKAINERLPYEMDYRIIRKDGEERYIHSIGKIKTSDNNDLLSVYGTEQDITERKRDEKEKEKLKAQLHQAQKMESIGNLAGGIAHDFNNILSSIIGFTELALDETEKGTTIEDSLQEVYTAGKRAKDLVRQILAFARQSDEQRAPIRPSKIALEVLSFIRSTIPATIEIRQNIESESLINGNATQVHQVLMNLCTNAAHAMEDSGGILETTIRDIFVDNEKTAIGMRQGDYAEIKVSDTGVGIPSDIIDSIFEPYFTTKDPGEGTGMGLAMVQGVIESYGGKITVDSQIGKGTTFTIYLPITKKRLTQREYAQEKLPTGTEHILIVDDEAPIAKMSSRHLKGLGYSVTSCTSSIEALEMFQAKPDDFDLIVTDMTMANMTGDKLAIELMKIRPDIPVILCTGYSKKISDETASEIGIKAFAYKPVVKADLAKTVRKVLDETKGTSHD
jgi:PAS domain S-box-containing protein